MEKKKKSMKLRTRVIISFFIIILVPIVMCALTFYFFVGYKAKIIGEKYGLANATYRTISNNTLLLNAMTSEEYDEVEDTAKSDTAKLEETNYLSVLNARLQKKQSFIAVREDGVIIYNGSEELSSEELENELPKYGDPGANLKGGVYFRNEKQWMVKQVDYKNSDGKECSAFIVTKTDQIAPQITGMVKELGIVIVLILVLTSLGLSFWIYRGVIGPLEQLKKATQNIKDGNLDFTVEPCGVAEINDLCEDFEEMRIRLKETAEEKVEFDKENKELISNISHDLKTPITAVKGYVEGIMDGVANTPEKMDRYIRTIYNKANEMDRLINELTFYSKIDTNRIPYTFSKIHIADYFDDCVEELNLELDAQHVDLTYFNYLEDDPIVIADAEQIKRVINNIVSNSIKYMDKSHKVINIRLRDVGDFVQVEIEDNGKGIATKDLTKIFDRFYRTDASRNSTRGGSGIGLSIVKKILEDHGGKVWATSKEGVGTTMYFVLRKISGGTCFMSKILIVEDEESIADLEKDYLELSGFEVEIENQGDTGLVRAIKEDFDLLILDLMLPEVDGFEICREVREKKDIPIIMVSAKKDDIDKIRGLGLGADDYMTKPFSPSELVARVKAHLARYDRLVGNGKKENDVVEIRGIKIDKTARRVWVNGEEKQFTTKEFDLLTFLAENPNRVFTKEELFREIWDMESIGDIATVTVHIKKIREKIEFNTAKPQYIETIWGVGYRFKA